MKKGKSNNTFTFLIVLVIVCVFIGIVYLYVTTDGKLFSEVIQNITDSQTVKDNYNGVYTHVDSLNGSKTLFNGCSLSHIDDHILIINSDYYVYRSSCIGTFLKAQGKVKELDIHEDLEKDTFYIKYDGLTYNKDYATTTLEVGNKAAASTNKAFYPSDYQLLFKESQFEDAYYDISEKTIYGSSSDLRISFEHLEGESFKISLGVSKNKSEDSYFEYVNKDFDTLPDIYTFGGYVAIVERNESGSKYSYVLKVFSYDGLVYNSDMMLPIIVDDVTLNTNSNVYITFNSSDRDFRMYISDSKEICPSDTKKVGYYEFKIDYNYSTKSFEKPEFVKLGYGSGECQDIKEIVGG